MIKPSPSGILCREFIGVKISNLLADQMQFQGCLLVDHFEADIGETNTEDHQVTQVLHPQVLITQVLYPQVLITQVLHPQEFWLPKSVADD